MPTTHNRPIATLIKWFVDKRSGHVQDARPEIQRRFAYLDWSQQKKIALAFLSSGKADRQWIYAQLMQLWDDCFAPKIRENWEEYHEQRCGWIVIRYLPKDYVMANLDLFEGKRDYYYACRRFAADKDFVIDDSKLAIRDRFIIHGMSHKPMDGDKCLDDIFTYLYEICASKYTYPITNDREHGEVLEALDIKPVYGMMKDMERMGLDEHIAKLREWNRNVYKDIIHSDDWKQLHASNRSNDDYDSLRRIIMKMYVCKNLDKKYKIVHHKEQDILDELDAENLPDDFSLHKVHGDDWMPSELPWAAKEKEMRELIERNPFVETIIEELGLTTDSNEEAPF